MEDEPKTPISVRVTQSLLLLTALYFSLALAMTAIGFARVDLLSELRFALLFVIPSVVGFFALPARKLWSRRVATLALLSLWGFQLRVLDSFSDAISGQFAQLSILFWGLILVLAGFLVGIPLLLVKLYRGKSETNFFTRTDELALAAGDRLHLGDAVTDLDKSFFDRQADLLFK